MISLFPQAPVVTGTIPYTSVGSTPFLLWTGAGATGLVIATLGTCGVVFGSTPDMPVATNDNCFPVMNTWLRMPIGPNTKYISVISLDGDDDKLYYYIPGQ